MNEIEFQKKQLEKAGYELTRILPSVKGTNIALVQEVLNQLELCCQLLERVTQDD